MYIYIYIYPVICLKTNKISLNLKKTEVAIFKSKQKKLEFDLNIPLCGKDYILLKVLNTWE